LILIGPIPQASALTPEWINAEKANRLPGDLQREKTQFVTQRKACIERQTYVKVVVEMASLSDNREFEI
jgi:hypothetical protein